MSLLEKGRQLRDPRSSMLKRCAIYYSTVNKDTNGAVAGAAPRFNKQLQCMATSQRAQSGLNACRILGNDDRNAG